MNLEVDLETLFFYIEAKYKEHMEERLRWNHLNNSMTLLLRATNEGYKKVEMYTDIVKRLDGIVQKDTRTDEEIIEDTLNLFKEGS